MKILDVPQAGKRGVTVSQGGRYGQVSRALVIPTNPSTPAQSAARGFFGAASEGWRQLSQTQRNAWTAAAAGMQTKSKLGQSGAMTGLQLYVKVNNTLTTYGEPAVETPPAMPQFPALAVVALAITDTAGVVAIKLTCPTDPGDATIIRASAPQSAGVNSTPHTYVIGICPAPAAGACDITGLYTAKFGVPPVGTKVFIQANQYVDGYESPIRTFNAIVP